MEDEEGNLMVPIMLGGKQLLLSSQYQFGDAMSAFKLIKSSDGSKDEERLIQVFEADEVNRTFTLSLKGTLYSVTVRTGQEHALNEFMPKKEVIDTARMILSPMPGAIVSINVKVRKLRTPSSFFMSSYRI